MTGDKSLFSQFYPSWSHHTVCIANDSHAKVVGKGTIQLSEILTLYSVLFVPDLDCNLIFVRKLNKDLNCETKFLVNSSVFRDMESERMIGNAELCTGLYILKVDKSPIGHDLRTWCLTVNYEFNKDSAIRLWHFWLGHPNFRYLKRTYFLHYSLKKIQDPFIVIFSNCQSIHVVTILLVLINHLILSLLSMVIFGDLQKFQMLHVLDGSYYW